MAALTLRTHVNGKLDDKVLLTAKTKVAQGIQKYKKMVQVWFMDDDVEGDQRLEHKRSPPAYMELKDLYKKTGVEYIKVMRPS